MTQDVIRPDLLPGTPWIRRFPVRTPTLPPATHTNTYVVGRGRLAVIDPASPHPEEQEALARWIEELEREGERVELCVLTHHHLDHISGAQPLATRRGIPVAAHPETAALVAGRVRVDLALEEGAVLSLGDVVLEALHTPGHAPGHLCFADARSGAVIAGDMVSSVSTIIIDPPEGDMRLYLDSLERLRRLGARWLLPAHGEPIQDPGAALDHYVRHRLEREAKVLAALTDASQEIGALVPRAYPEIAPALHSLAARSLLAHLIKLRDEGRAHEADGAWRRGR